MAKLLWALTCQRVIVDKSTNTVSYVDGVESLGFEEFPTLLPIFWVATVWIREREGDDLLVRVRVINPSGKELMRYESESPMKLLASRHRLNIQVGAKEIEKPGVYTVVLQQKRGKNWRTEGTIPLVMVHVTEQEVKVRPKRHGKSKAVRKSSSSTGRVGKSSR